MVILFLGVMTFAPVRFYSSAARGCVAALDCALARRLDGHGVYLFGLWPRGLATRCQFSVLGVQLLFSYFIGLAKLVAARCRG